MRTPCSTAGGGKGRLCWGKQSGGSSESEEQEYHGPASPCGRAPERSEGGEQGARPACTPLFQGAPFALAPLSVCATPAAHCEPWKGMHCLLTPATPGTNLKHATLSEIRRSHKDSYCATPSMPTTQTRQTSTDSKPIRGYRGLREGGMESKCLGFLLGAAEKVWTEMMMTAVL